MKKLSDIAVVPLCLITVLLTACSEPEPTPTPALAADTPVPLAATQDTATPMPVPPTPAVRATVISEITLSIETASIGPPHLDLHANTNARTTHCHANARAAYCHARFYYRHAHACAAYGYFHVRSSYRHANADTDSGQGRTLRDDSTAYGPGLH